MKRVAALAALALFIDTSAEAGDKRRGAVLEDLRAGMPFNEIRPRVLRAGWHPFANDAHISRSRCEDQPRVCRAYREVNGCWRDGGATFCTFEYLDRRTRKPRLDDEVLRLRFRVGPGGSLIFHGHHTTSFGGHG